MKVTGTSATSVSTRGKAARSTAGFSLGQSPATAQATATTASAAAVGVADVSVLMALQGVEGPLERRKRAVRRGGGLLDRLDELKMALLSGDAGEATIQRLGSLMREERPEDDDPGLKSVLDQIDLRAAVEMAKAELRQKIDMA